MLTLGVLNLKGITGTVSSKLEKYNKVQNSSNMVKITATYIQQAHLIKVRKGQKHLIPA